MLTTDQVRVAYIMISWGYYILDSVVDEELDGLWFYQDGIGLEDTLDARYLAEYLVGVAI